ncbi:MAG: fused MFS/spermidine synthase [Bacteroidota bacterium]
MPMQLSRVRAIVILLFILSGISGLIYEVTWSKYLYLFIGSTSYSNMIVLATFMGGLALGSYYWGKYADGAVNLFRLYGVLELAVGVYCIFYPFLILICEKIFVHFAVRMDIVSDQWLLLSLKFLLSFITLIVPTFFMGGTLPILTKYLTRTIETSGRDVATLYYINSLGAVLGAALAGFFLIRLFSIDGALGIAAALNIGIGTTALLVSKKIQPRSTQREPVQNGSVEPGTVFTPTGVRLAIFTATVSGFVAMLYELTWIRLLSNILGSSTYSFSLMLIAFISGITLGSWIVSRVIQKIKNITTLLGMCQIGTAVFMICTLPFYERFPYYLIKIASLLSNTPDHFPLFLFYEFVFCFLIMIIPTSLSGMSLPIASRIASNDIRWLGKSIGGIFSVNTIGSVIGAMITGLVLMPKFGIKQTIEFGVLINALLGLTIIFIDGTIPMRWRVGIALALVVIGTGYRIQYPSWDQTISIMGVFRGLFTRKYESFDAMKQDATKDEHILWYKEGVNANVAVTDNEKGKAYQRCLVINGKVDASTHGDLATQVLLGQTPLMMVPDTGDALVIGLGSGITCGSALTHPLRSLDCVEICPEVVECNSYFNEANYNFSRDPRVKIYVDDAITYMKITPKKYDYIISEPSNPWIAGIGNLFSKEFFEISKSRLRKGGVLAQWFHTYEMNDDVFNLILNTIVRSFRYVTVWKMSDPDLLVMASEDPIIPDFKMMQSKFAVPSIANDFARINIFDAATLLSTQIATEAKTASYFGQGEINTEKRPLLEFQAPLAFFSGSDVTITDSIDERFSSSGNNLFFGQYHKKYGLSFQNYLNMARFRDLVLIGDFQMTHECLRKCIEIDPKHVETLSLMGQLAEYRGTLEDQITALRMLYRVKPDDERVLSDYISEVLISLNNGTYVGDPQDMECLMNWATTLSDSGKNLDAAKLYSQIITVQKNGAGELNKRFEEKLSTLAAANFIAADELDQAQLFIDRVAFLNPGSKQLIVLKDMLNAKRLGRNGG